MAVCGNKRKQDRLSSTLDSPADGFKLLGVLDNDLDRMQHLSLENLQSNHKTIHRADKAINAILGQNNVSMISSIIWKITMPNHKPVKKDSAK